MSTLILEAFGQLSPGTNLIDSEEEDLYSVFSALAVSPMTSDLTSLILSMEPVTSRPS